jgi:hypothetical protein
MIIFFLETYLDLFLGGMLNTENDYLLDNPDNWGRRGDLTFSDQFCVIVGNIIYIGCMLFPFIVIFILDLKYAMRYQNPYKRAGFDKLYDILYHGLITNQSGAFHYYSVYLIRKFLFAHIVFYFHEI